MADAAGCAESGTVQQQPDGILLRGTDDPGEVGDRVWQVRYGFRRGVQGDTVGEWGRQEYDALAG